MLVHTSKYPPVGRVQGTGAWRPPIMCAEFLFFYIVILIICRMALVPSRSDEIEKLKLPGDLDPVTFDLELDPPFVRSHVPRITHAKFHLIPSNGLAAYKGQTNIFYLFSIVDNNPGLIERRGNTPGVFSPVC